MSKFGLSALGRSFASDWGPQLKNNIQNSAISITQSTFIQLLHSIALIGIQFRPLFHQTGIQMYFTALSSVHDENHRDWIRIFNNSDHSLSIRYWDSRPCLIQTDIRYNLWQILITAKFRLNATLDPACWINHSTSENLLSPSNRRNKLAHTLQVVVRQLLLFFSTIAAFFPSLFRAISIARYWTRSEKHEFFSV